MNVMFYEVFKEEEAALRKALPDGIKAGFTQETLQAFGPEKPPAKLLCVRTQSRVPAAWAGSIDGVLTRSAGYDHLLHLKAEGKNGPSLGYLPEYCSTAVAEYALLAVLSLFRRLQSQVKQFEKFDRSNLTGRECRDKVLFVLGVGRIGSEVVRLGRGIGMNVKGFDRLRAFAGLDYVALDEGLSQSDAVTCCLPLTAQTQGLLDYEKLKKIKRGALFVNVSRAEIAPVPGLKKCLEEGLLGGLALDVYESEGALADYLRHGHGRLDASGRAVWDLRHDSRVLLTPHNAFNTEEALYRKVRQSIDSALMFLEKKKFPWPLPEGPEA